MKRMRVIILLLCVFIFVCGCAAKGDTANNGTESVQNGANSKTSGTAADDSKTEEGIASPNSVENSKGLASMEQFAQSEEVTEIIDEFAQANSGDIDFELSVEENGTRLVCTAQYSNSSLTGDDGVKIYRTMEPMIQQAWQETGGVPSISAPEFELYCYSDDGRLVYDHLADLSMSESD